MDLCVPMDACQWTCVCQWMHANGLVCANGCMHSDTCAPFTADSCAPCTVELCAPSARHEQCLWWTAGAWLPRKCQRAVWRLLAGTLKPTRLELGWKCLVCAPCSRVLALSLSDMSGQRIKTRQCKKPATPSLWIQPTCYHCRVPLSLCSQVHVCCLASLHVGRQHLCGTHVLGGVHRSLEDASQQEEARRSGLVAAGVAHSACGPPTRRSGSWGECAKRVCLCAYFTVCTALQRYFSPPTAHMMFNLWHQNFQFC